MKNILLSLSFVFVSLFGVAQFPYYEGFDYTVGDSLPQHSWTGINSGDQILVTNGSLNYSGLTPSIGNKISFDGYGRDFQKTFTSQTTGTVYMSFIFQVTNIGSDTTGGYFTGFGANSITFGSTVWTKQNGTGFNIGLNARSTITYTSWDTTIFDINIPIFIVISYEIVAGTTNDIAKMWINPNSAFFGGTTPPAPTLTITNGGTDLTDIDRIFVRQDSPSETPYIDMDEIRVNTNWTDVTTIKINKIFDNNNFGIFPNPATNFVTISANELVSQVLIYDMQGRIVQEYDYNGTLEIKLNVSELSKGLYNIIAYSTKGNVFRYKLEK